MTKLETILTHPGGAHKDELLACCILLALFPVAIVRREPTEDDLNNPVTAVIDVGHRHEPALSNFDHHQFPRDHPPTCSLSLVLKDLGLYADARQFCDWLEAAEWFDTRGPFETAKWLGVEREALSKLISPIEITLLRRFALAEWIRPGEPLWEILRMTGQDILDHVKTLRARLDFIGAHAEFWTLPNSAKPAQVLFLPRTDPIPEEPSSGLDRFVESRGLSDQVVALVYPDRRSSGYGLSRFRDSARMDFTRIQDAPSVHFAHARGFVAKTSATDVAELKRLVGRSLVDL